MSVHALRRGARRQDRSGAVIALMALLMVPMLAMVAFSVDYGYLLKVETDLQRCADAAALAAVQDLIPADDGTQDFDACRATIRLYTQSNIAIGFQVLDADIEVGRYDPATIYSNVSLLNTGVADCVRVTLRRDTQANSQVALFFAPLLGIQQSGVSATATAVLQKPTQLPPGADVLPFAVPQAIWDGRGLGEEWSIYGDGKVTDFAGATVPGNWGTVDIGPTNNSTSDLNDQILNGLRQTDVDALHADGRISTNTHIDGNQPTWLEADTGLSSGLKSSVQAIHGQKRMVPIYDVNTGSSGNNLQYQIVKWGVVKVVDSNWNGANNTNVTIAKSYDYIGDLKPQPDLSGTTVIEGVFTTPALVE